MSRKRLKLLSLIHLLTSGWCIKPVMASGTNVSEEISCQQRVIVAMREKKEKEKSASLPRPTYKSAFDPAIRSIQQHVAPPFQLSISSLAQILAVSSFLLFFLSTCWQLVNDAQTGTCFTCQPALTSAGSLLTPMGLHSDSLSVTCSVCQYSSTWPLLNEKKKI